MLFSASVKSTEFISNIIFNAIEHHDNLRNKVNELAFDEVWKVRNKSDIKIEDIFEAMMDDDNVSTKFEDLAKSGDIMFSPLLLSIIQWETHSSFVQEYLLRISMLQKDKPTFITLLKSAGNLFSLSSKAMKNVSLNLDSTKMPPESEFDKNFSLFREATISKINELLYFGPEDSSKKIDAILEKAPETFKDDVVDKALDMVSYTDNFSPLLDNKYTLNVSVLLKFSKLSMPSLVSLTDKFFSKVLLYLESKSSTVENLELMQQCWKLLNFNAEQSMKVLDQILKIPVPKMCENPAYVSILTNVCHSLIEKKFLLDDSTFARMMCVIEVLAANEKTETAELVASLTKLIEEFPTLISSIGTNFVTVLLKKLTPVNILMLKVLLAKEKKHYETIKSWICMEKQQLNSKVIIIPQYVFPLNLNILSRYGLL